MKKTFLFTSKIMSSSRNIFENFFKILSVVSPFFLTTTIIMVLTTSSRLLNGSKILSYRAIYSSRENYNTVLLMQVDYTMEWEIIQYPLKSLLAGHATRSHMSRSAYIRVIPISSLRVSFDGTISGFLDEPLSNICPDTW